MQVSQIHNEAYPPTATFKISKNAKQWVCQRKDNMGRRVKGVEKWVPNARSVRRVSEKRDDVRE
jgi:hypothetical protein